MPTVITDCEECNKKALLELNSLAEKDSLPPELTLLIPLPDVVHLGKSMKCGWFNWLLNLDGERSNLVLIRTLRDMADPDTKTKPRKLLSLECVRNKDRMAVEPIVHLTCPDVLSILENIEFVVHTLVPKKYRLWNSNPSGACTRPVAVAVGPPGNILALDYDFDTLTLNLVTSHVTYPSREKALMMLEICVIPVALPLSSSVGRQLFNLLTSMEQ